ncbi:MAG: T9SS type A sorting domain-containing protein [Flavobacteriales bacterium]|nr:T9SS type A sorting domain-containing protein [Flavobacteriales bacterium]
MSNTRLLLPALLALSVSEALAQHTCREKHLLPIGLDLRSATAARSDTIDLLHTRIDLDMTQVGGGTIAASCAQRLTAKLPNVSQLRFDLLALTVDSVMLNGSALPFAQSGETLTIDLPNAIGPGDTLEPVIHYHGDPEVDASGWGGFYTAGTIIYNLGVAFDSQPHSFGRAWFPCFDNFVERSTYELHVRTNGGRHAWCSGVLQGETDLGGGLFESHWLLDRSIPSYLASVTAAPYAVVRDTLPTIGGTPCPVDLVALPGDTTGMKSSFTNLPGAFEAFEAWFGPHTWPRVGYCLTPQGAMEHPTNISYPSSIANGSLTYEATMAHELAHHWFGDQVTCERAEEMYLNEGFAEYLSHLFLEHVYGRARYLQEVRENHHQMVWNSHLQDEGWWALADMPQEHTYGAITYNKGADVLHTLRGYLGDSLFRTGLTSFLDQYAFRAVSTTLLRDHLSTNTGVDLTDFFNDWILQPGWAAFEVDSFEVNTTPLPGGLWQTQVFIEQKQRGPAQAYHNVPMTVTFVNDQGTRWSAPQPHPLGPGTTSITAAPPFIPVRVLLNVDDRISHAVTVHEDTLDATGIYDLDLADVRFTVTTMPQPTPVRIEEHWVAADTYTDVPNLYKVSPDRWWRMHMDLPTGAQVTSRIRFDGRASVAGGLDTGLMQDTAGVAFHEDSLMLLYRPNAYFPWAPYPDHTVNNVGSETDRNGRFELGHVEAGDYTLGFRYSATGVRERQEEARWTVTPNPTNGLVTVNCDRRPAQGTSIRVHDLNGRTVLEVPVNGKRTSIDLSQLSAGTYVAGLVGAGSGYRHIGRIVLLNER